MPEVEIGAANSRICRGVTQPSCILGGKHSLFRCPVDLLSTHPLEINVRRSEIDQRSCRTARSDTVYGE